MRCVPVLLLLAHMATVDIATARWAKPPRLDLNGDQLPEGAIARLGTIRFQSRRHVRASALSQDGTIVAVATQDGEKKRIDFLDTSTGKTIRSFDPERFEPDRMHFTPDGNGLVFGGWFGIRLLDRRTGKLARAIEIQLEGGSVIALASDGKWVAAQPRKYVKHAPVVVWDAKTGKEVASLPGRGASCKGLAFGSDGKRLLLASLVPTQVNDSSIGFGPESKVALACIDVAMRKVVGETVVATGQFVALCPDGETVAIEAADHRSISVRHLPTGANRCVIPVKPSRFAFSPDGKVLFTIDEIGRGTLWDAKKGDQIRDLEGVLVNKDFDIVGISKDGRTVAVLDGGWGSTARFVVWNAATGKRIGRPAGHDGTVTCIAYAPDGKLLASGSIDKTVRLWNPATGKHLRVATVHQGPVAALAISPDGKLLASSSLSGLIRVSNLADGKLVEEFFGAGKGAKTLAFSRDGRMLFAAGDSPLVLARDIAGGKEVKRFETGTAGTVMAFGNDGTLALANGGRYAWGSPEQLQVWNTTKKRPAAPISLDDPRGGSVRCEAAIFSPDGRTIASSQVSEYQGIRPSYGADQVRLWDRLSGEPIRTLAPSATKVLAFSPNGRLLAFGAPGKSGHLRIGYGSGIDIYDTLTGEIAGKLPVSPECIAFSPDGSHLATGGRDHDVLIWESPKIRPRTKAKAPTVAECDAWWAALGGDAKGAYEAIGRMLDAPEQSVKLLKERVRPVAIGGPDAAAKLIARLDSDTFAERENAQQALAKWGGSVEHLLLEALRGDVSPEFRLRAGKLLKGCDDTSPLGRQRRRAVVALEAIGTPTARSLLRTLADGSPSARLTIESRAALKRLGR